MKTWFLKFATIFGIKHIWTFYMHYHMMHYFLCAGIWMMCLFTTWSTLSVPSPWRPWKWLMGTTRWNIMALCFLSVGCCTHLFKCVTYNFIEICYYLTSVTTNVFMPLTSSGSVFLSTICVSGAISVCCGQAAGDWPCQHGPHWDPVETVNWPLTGGKIYLDHRLSKALSLHLALKCIFFCDWIAIG